MPLDPRIRAAIKEAVSDAGQPPELATKLLAWFESLASGNASLEDRDDTARHLELLYEVTLAAEATDGGGRVMATQVTILGWKAEGLRCPDHEVSFLDKDDKAFPITLIQIPNGTGKTTTLELLRATLSGAAAGGRWDAEKVLSLRKREPLATEGLFQVEVPHGSWTAGERCKL